jgi:flagellar biogenesis protein FliO
MNGLWRLVGVSLLMPALSAAQTLGTKSDSAALAGGGSPVGVMPLLQMLFALGIVFALLRFGLPKVANRLNKHLATPLNSSIRIEESANFAGGALYLVSVKHRTLLLSVGTHGVNCLADVTDPVPIAESATFEELVQSAPDWTPTEPQPEPDGSLSTDAIKAALDRLSRLPS